MSTAVTVTRHVIEMSSKGARGAKGETGNPPEMGGLSPFQLIQARAAARSAADARAIARESLILP
jgi:hypothetical protein